MQCSGTKKRRIGKKLEKKVFTHTNISYESVYSYHSRGVDCSTVRSKVCGDSLDCGSKHWIQEFTK